MNANVTNTSLLFTARTVSQNEHRHSRFPGDDFAPDSCLYSNLKHLPGDGFLQPYTHGFPCVIGPVSKSSSTAKALIKTKSIMQLVTQTIVCNLNETALGLR